MFGLLVIITARCQTGTGEFGGRYEWNLMDCGEWCSIAKRLVQGLGWKNEWRDLECFSRLLVKVHSTATFRSGTQEK